MFSLHFADEIIGDARENIIEALKPYTGKGYCLRMETSLHGSAVEEDVTLDVADHAGLTVRPMPNGALTDHAKPEVIRWCVYEEPEYAKDREIVSLYVY